MGDKIKGAISRVQRWLGDWMDDSGHNKADVADLMVPVAAALSAVLATVFWELAPTELGLAAVARGETVVALIMTLVTLVLTFVTGKRSLTTRKEARLALSTFSNSISGVADAVAALTKSDATLTDCNRFVDSVLTEAAKLMPISQCRATLYGLDEDENATGEGQYLKRIGHSKGRSDDARLEFRPDTEHGRDVVKIVMAGSARYVSSHRLKEFTIQRDREAIWRSFCIIPISTQDGVWGGLFLDSDRITMFSDEKKQIAMSIARFLQVGIDELDRAARDVRPEISEALSQLGGVAQENVRPDSYSGFSREGEGHGEGA